MKKVPVIISMVLVFMVCSLTISAQTTIVKGILADSLTKECEPYATIRVYKAKDKTKFLLQSENVKYDDFDIPKDKIHNLWLIEGWMLKTTSGRCL